MGAVSDALKTATDAFAAAIADAEGAVNPRDLGNLRKVIARRLASAGAAEVDRFLE